MFFVTVFLFKKYVKSNKKRFDAEASNLKLLERVTGIEPAYSAWEADVLPLNYTRKNQNSSVKPSCYDGAGDVTRTHDLLITNQLHYRLCYTSGTSTILA